MLVSDAAGGYTMENSAVQVHVGLRKPIQPVRERLRLRHIIAVHSGAGGFRGRTQPQRGG
ncbi:hypothetical protein PF003_g23915 [Phytophthora fragariae]|nr:hypothetical protein PF003_g23915 [Phytophthora fragariae]